MSSTVLSALLDLVSQSTRQLQVELRAARLPEPWLDAPALHPWDEHTPPLPYWHARRTLLSALAMMTALLQNPREKLLVDGMGYHHPAALNFVVRARIPDILAAPGHDERRGLPVDDIARRAGTHPAKTTAVLRFLSIHHIFTETAPRVFANNKLSHLLKAAEPTSAAPIFWGEVAFRAATALSPSLRDPATAFSFAPTDAPFARAFAPGFANLDLLAPDVPAEQAPPPTPFTFLAAPQHTAYRASFAAGMRALDLMHGPDGLRDVPWAQWDSPAAVFVDIGASTGHLARTVLPALRYASFVCQDTPEVCAQGAAFFKEYYPDEKRVVFQGNDFFTGQPVKGAPLYILSNILHNWPAEEGLCILRHIAAAMAPASRLLVIEVVLRPAVAQASSSPPARPDDKASAEAAAALAAPWPLLADYGNVNGYAHHQSVEMLSLFNSLDRTLPEYTSMFREAGLELVLLHPVRKVVSVMEVRRSL